MSHLRAHENNLKISNILLGFLALSSLFHFGQFFAFFFLVELGGKILSKL